MQYNTIIYLKSITSGKVALTPEPRAHVENARVYKKQQTGFVFSVAAGCRDCATALRIKSKQEEEEEGEEEGGDR